GHECSLEGVFWHTGENDTYFTPYRQNYAVWMQRCIFQVRQDFKSPNLPWFISEQHPAAIWKNSDDINESLRAMAQSEKGVIMVTTSQLPHERRHFGTKGTLLLGEEFAEAYWKQLRVNRP
ncbi:MAG: sialate O-acetylesterase, partial [Limisphaerales bacterium]